MAAPGRQALHDLCARRARALRGLLRAQDRRRAAVPRGLSRGQVAGGHAHRPAHRSRAGREAAAQGRPARDRHGVLGRAARPCDAPALRPHGHVAQELPRARRAGSRRRARRVHHHAGPRMNSLAKPWFGALAALLTGLLFLASLDLGPVGPLAFIAPVPLLLYALSAPRAWSVVLAAFVARVIGMAMLVIVYTALPPIVFVVMGTVF